MPLMKGRLVRSIKVREDDGSILEIKLWQVPPSGDKLHGYKYSLVYIVKDERVIGYDTPRARETTAIIAIERSRISLRTLTAF